MSRKLLDDCFLHDKERMRHDECVTIIRERLSRVVDVETVALGEAAGRWLAEDIVSPRNVPLHTNAAVDGYAFNAAEIGTDGARLRVSARVAAGDTDMHALAAGEAARIFTGAAMPAGADTVAMQEDCTHHDDGTVSIPSGLKAGANRRKAGEDVAEGATVLEAGARLRPQDIAALASLGLVKVPVFSPLRVAILSTGNELREPGASIATGQVFDSNRSMLKALCATLPVSVTDLGIRMDDANAIEGTIADAAKTHDAILTTGGASRGEEDHIVDAIDRLGKRHLWQIAVKPGRPMSFGQVGDCVFLGLPGNPVAAFVCFLLYARTAFTVLGGGTWRAPQQFMVPAGFSIPKKKPDRREFWRGWIEDDADGQPVAMKFERDGSRLISGLRQASGLIDIPEEVTSVTKGEPVRFLPFSEFGIG